MKKKLILLLIISAFIACKSKNSSTDKDSIINNTYSNKQSAELIQKFKPIIQGVWVKKDYIDKVVATKSPMTAADLASGLTTMYIETDSLKGDSMKVDAGWNNHEGSDLTLKFKPGKTSETILLGDFDLGYSIKNGDTSIVLYGYDKEKNEHTTTWYVKAFNKQKNLGDGMGYLINKGLIAGTYKMTDSIGKSSTVTFTALGKVSGFENLKTYSIQNDLGGEPMNNLDNIMFDMDLKTRKDFTFKFNADTLSFYDTKANGDSTELLVDKLRYKFVRQK
ncbi:MAG: hypothetical protein M3O71_29760 [Bacteroidota bacterium]|nr:hypothetical protein [Bacteroidota bacterium]